MRRNLLWALMVVVLAAAVSLLAVGTPVATAQAAGGAASYKIDPAHASVAFRSTHVSINHIYGLFTDTQGSFTLDKENAGASSLDVSVKASSVFTGQSKRDDHLKSPDFFNAKEFPTIHFKSTKVAAGSAAGSYEVTGDLTLHGVTKPITVTLQNLGDAEFPPNSGMHRTGLVTDFTIKRSDFGMQTMIGPNGIGDEVKIMVGLEGIKQ